ncbi:MAG: IS701 family transposase [Janthinobacterium lividum]
MTCTLDLYTDYLLSSTGPTSATGLSRLVDGALSHDQITRWLNATYLDSKELWTHAKPLIRQVERQLVADEFAVLIVDDSIVEKTHTDENTLICTHYDHSKNRYVRGLNFVSLLYQARNLALPIAVELVEKTDLITDVKTQKNKYVSKLTKNEMFRQMLRQAQQQVSYRYLLADSWYASAENMQAVLDLKHDFVLAMPSSRTVALGESARKHGKFVALDSVCFPAKKPLLVYLRALDVAVLVVRQVFTNQDGSEGVLYLVSSDTSLDYEQITTIYQRRWKVEEYHKSLKQHTGIGHSPTRTPATQANHFFASMLAYIKLETLKIRHSIGHFRLKAQLYTVGLKAMYQHLSMFTA